MNRRASLKTLIGKNNQNKSRASGRSSLFSLNAGLNPYEGPWEFEQAAHLLRRSTFGPSLSLIKQAQQQGLDATIEQLFEEQAPPAPPVYYDTNEDPGAAQGSTWIETPYPPNQDVRGNRRRSLRAWTWSLLLAEGISIREKLTLFWQNHFAVIDNGDPRFVYRHAALLRNYAWGNFRDLIKEVTIDPIMLRYLNGNQNTDNAPNENFARELLELYTIGKGPQVGPGDYTNYTEHDIIEIAKILTGWRDRAHNSTNPDLEIGSYFTEGRHDTTVKTLSHRFDEVQIPDMGDQEFLHLIDIIFQKEEVARFICRKLYRWFVYYTIDDLTEVDIIEPMAEILLDNDFEIKPALQALLSSEHFFDALNVGPMIKNPIDFSLSVLKQLEVPFPDGSDLQVQYGVWLSQFYKTDPMGMEYFQPPNVAGWKAYYQEPLYYRTWINATTLPARMAFTDRMAANGYNNQEFRIKIQPLEFIHSLENPLDPNALVQELAALLFPQALSEEQKASLKDILIPGLPDFEWTVEYGEYAADPENSDLAESVEAKLKSLLKVMMSMPEFYLS